VRAVGHRYRIIYGIREDEVLVHVLALGIRKEGDRKDIYQLARKLLSRVGSDKEDPVLNGSD
jgi:mRNA interferase RelE/StbE